MTSCILLPRSCFALCSPSVQRMASATFDLPQPFGPIMAVTPCWKGISTLSANDLKPRSSIFSSFIEFPLKQIFNIIPYTRGGHKRKRKCFTKSAKHQTFVKHTPKSKKNPLDKRISGDSRAVKHWVGERFISCFFQKFRREPLPRRAVPPRVCCRPFPCRISFLRP